MFEKYREILNKKGLVDIDIISEDGRFYSGLKSFQDSKDNNSLIGYNGAINIEENNTGLIYTRRIRKFVKNSITKDFNELVLENFLGETKTISLSQCEERDYMELYEEYKLNPELFEQKQRLLEKKYNSHMKLKFFDIQRKFLKDIVDSLYNELEEIEEKIKKSQIRLVKVMK